MTSSLTNDPFERPACMSCSSCDALSTHENTSHHHVFQLSKKDYGDTTKPEMKQTEDILAAEMWKLSTQERSSALDDIHCVSEEFKETPEMVQQSLADFKEAVQKGGQNPFYEMAINQNRAYLEDPKFRLKFLRAKMYNVGEAVRQMMSFLQNKATYFGNDKIARDISLDDLQDEEKQLLLSGLFHIQDERDKKGRVITHLFGKMLSRCRADTMIRMAHYLYYNILASCPDVQMKGLVAVYNDTTLPGENLSIPGFNFLKETQVFFDSLPIRYSAMHYCLQPRGQNLAINNAVVSIFLLGLPQYARVRTRIHIGSIMESQYRLQSYGIPLKSLPFDVDGNAISTELLNLWFYKHCEDMHQIALPDEKGEIDFDQLMMPPPLHANSDESMSWDTDGWQLGDFDQMGSSNDQDEVRAESIELTAPGAGIIATETDVLFGKGYRLQSHPGNVRFREFLEQYEEEYESTSRSNKREIAIQIARILCGDGTRFLYKAESGEWVESNIALATKKIAQYFRELRKKRVKGRPPPTRAQL